MRRLGLRGVRHGKVVRTTAPDANAPCPLERVNRQFKAQRPNQLWVSDFTCVSRWQGWQYVAFVIGLTTTDFLHRLGMFNPPKLKTITIGNLPVKPPQRNA